MKCTSSRKTARFSFFVEAPQQPEAPTAEAPQAEPQRVADRIPDHNIPLTPKKWDNEFGESGIVSTPLGDVKMGDNQYLKLARNGRSGKLGIVKLTLTSPQVIIKDFREPSNGTVPERNYSLVFVKTFVKSDVTQQYYFASITVSKDGKEVVISNEERNKNRISKLLQEGKVAWIEGYDSLYPKSQNKESIPLDDSRRPTKVDNQPAELGINSPAVSDDKVIDSQYDSQTNSVKGLVGSVVPTPEPEKTVRKS